MILTTDESNATKTSQIRGKSYHQKLLGSWERCSTQSVCNLGRHISEEEYISLVSVSNFSNPGPWKLASYQRTQKSPKVKCSIRRRSPHSAREEVKLPMGTILSPLVRENYSGSFDQISIDKQGRFYLTSDFIGTPSTINRLLSEIFVSKTGQNGREHLYYEGSDISIASVPTNTKMESNNYYDPKTLTELCLEGQVIEGFALVSFPEGSKEGDFPKSSNWDNMVVKHLECGQEFLTTSYSFFHREASCPFHMRKKQSKWDNCIFSVLIEELAPLGYVVEHGGDVPLTVSPLGNMVRPKLNWDGRITHPSSTLEVFVDADGHPKHNTPERANFDAYKSIATLETSPRFRVVRLRAGDRKNPAVLLNVKNPRFTEIDVANQNGAKIGKQLAELVRQMIPV